MAVSHWYTSVVFQGLVLIILTLLLLVAAVIPLIVQLIFSRRRLAYELRAAAPLIQAPMGVGENLTVVYDGVPLERPYFAELRLINLSRRDIPSSTFDQEMPLRFDLGIKLIKLLQVTHIPNKLPAPKIHAAEAAIEVGPS